MNLLLSSRDLSTDDPFLVAAIPSHDPAWCPDDSWEPALWSKSRIINAIVGVARSYRAHFPDLMGSAHERIIFNHVQADSVATEVSFVGEVLNDPIVSDHCQIIAALAAKVAASDGRLILVFEGQ